MTDEQPTTPEPPEPLAPVPLAPVPPAPDLQPEPSVPEPPMNFGEQMAERSRPLLQNIGPVDPVPEKTHD